MSRALDLRGAAVELGVTPPSRLLDQWEKDLEDELASIRLFPDTLDIITRLQQSGYLVGQCSNLALPYGAAVRALLPMLNAYAMSYDAGAVKPQPHIYQFLLEQLGCIADEVLFVGDTVVADLEGPRAFGMQACLLNRSAGQALADSGSRCSQHCPCSSCSQRNAGELSKRLSKPTRFIQNPSPLCDGTGLFRRPNQIRVRGFMNLKHGLKAQGTRTRRRQHQLIEN